jgi:hypothetical protein
LRAQNNTVQPDPNDNEIVRPTNVWFTTNVTPNQQITEVVKPKGQRKVLIVVANRAEAALNDQVSALEDLISSRVAGRGFTVVSRDVAVNALKTYAPANAATAAAGTTQLDQELSDNTSALRLAQNLGVDYLLVPAITSYGKEKKSYQGNGIKTLNTTYRLRLNYKIVEADQGGAERGGTVLAEKTVRDTGALQTDSSDVLNELLDDAADQLAAAMTESAKSLPTAVAKAAMVHFSVVCTMTDPRLQPILVPDIRVAADNTVIATNQPVAVQPMDVTVELDGVALGSAPGEFAARPGLHKLRLSREGFSDWTRTVNIYDGQTLRVALQMSPQGYARWQATTDFLATLDNQRKLTDAEVKRVEGLAEFLKNSHYRVDTKEGTKIYKSIY